MTIPADLAAELRAVRRARGWTVREAAAVTGIAPLRVTLLEMGGARVLPDVAGTVIAGYELGSATASRLRRIAEDARREERERQPREGWLSSWNDRAWIHIATIGRRSGQWHTRAWGPFVADGDRLALVAGPEPSSWLANVVANPEMRVWHDRSPVHRASGALVPAEHPTASRLRSLVATRVGEASLAESGRVVLVEVARATDPRLSR